MSQQVKFTELYDAPLILAIKVFWNALLWQEYEATFQIAITFFSDSKNSTPEPESEDSQPKEQEEEEKEQLLVLEPPSATTTSTLGKS